LSTDDNWPADQVIVVAKDDRRLTEILQGSHCGGNDGVDP
jgi:hypothetical protein